MRLRSHLYAVTWRWADEPEYRVRADEVKAPTATRAISKVKALLRQEYSFANSDILFLEVIWKE